jgi:hypothetical protein
MNWFQLLDVAESRLRLFVSDEQAECMVNRADSHSPWFDEVRSGKLFKEADVERLIDWLIARKNEKDFQP